MVLNHSGGAESSRLSSSSVPGGSVGDRVSRDPRAPSAQSAPPHAAAAVAAMNPSEAVDRLDDSVRMLLLQSADLNGGARGGSGDDPAAAAAAAAAAAEGLSDRSGASSGGAATAAGRRRRQQHRQQPTPASALESRLLGRENMDTFFVERNDLIVKISLPVPRVSASPPPPW